MSCVKVLKHVRRKADKYVLNVEIEKVSLLIAFVKERYALKLYRALVDPSREQQTMNAPTILGVSNMSNIEISMNRTVVKNKRTPIGEMVYEKPETKQVSMKQVSIKDIEEVQSEGSAGSAGSTGSVDAKTTDPN